MLHRGKASASYERSECFVYFYLYAMLHLKVGDNMEKKRYSRTFWNGIIACVICFLLAFGLIASAIVSKIQYDNLVENMLPTKAQIIDIDLDISVRGPDEQEIYITYEVDGIVYERELATDTTISFDAGTEANYSVGDWVEILYNPENPNQIASPRSVSVANVFMWLGLAFLVFMLLVLYLIISGRKRFLITEEEHQREKHLIEKRKRVRQNGKKVRWQYFNVYIYFQLSVLPGVPLMIILLESKKDGFNFWNLISEMLEATPVVLMIYAIFIGPFIILSILNRLYFGKVVGVLEGSTLFLSDREIDINNIIEIQYHPMELDRPYRYHFEYCYATLVLQSQNGGNALVNITHFPLYGVRLIKKQNPNIKIKLAKSIWFFAFTPTVIFVVLGLILKI